MCVINGNTNAVVARVSVGTQTFRVAADPHANTIYVTDPGSGTVSVLNGRTNAVVATVKVGSRPLGVAINPRAATAYVANGASNTVSVLRSCRHLAAAAAARCRRK